MKTHFYQKFSLMLVALFLWTTSIFAQVIPTITGPAMGELETIGAGITLDVPYSTDPGMNGYVWTVSSAGLITSGQGTEAITVTWTNPTGLQTVSVTYTGATQPGVLTINYFPFAGPIDPALIPQFVDPLPHFAAGLRVDATNVSNLVIRTVKVQQQAVSTGTPLAGGGTAGGGNGQANFAAYQISKDGGATWGPAMYPAQTIEAKQGNPLTVEYRNELYGVKYTDFNILADQTLLKMGYTPTGNPLTDPYTGDIPMVVHLHGGEIPSNSDGGPQAWFTPGYAEKGPAFQHNAENVVSYPNKQEATTLWYHPHDDGLTRINVFTGLAGFYFLRGNDEEAAKLPGWSGDGLVREITPPGATPTFNGSNTYLPEIEVAIQDRAFDVNGQLYWPVAPPNPELHPYWTPEFVGDIMTVNGKTWPYLSVAPRKYRFRLLDGCNARWLNLWLVDAADPNLTTPGPAITVVGGDGGLLSSPATLDPASGKTLLIGPGQRYDVVIDFSGVAPGSKFILMNDANAPYPGGDPVVPGLSDRIMQFVVNGEMVGADNSQVPMNLRQVPMVKLTDFSGNLTTGVNPVIKRQIILNEVSATGGPAAVQVNNSYYESPLAIANDPYNFGAATEFMQEGTTEIIQIANVSADAHPLHIHLLQWQLVSRQPIDDVAYLAEYAKAWAARNPPIPEFPAGLGYPGGAGPPYDYNTPNADDAVGGNPEFSSFITGPAVPAQPEEMGWKDNTTVMPGEVTTFVVRIAPTDAPIDATPDKLLFPFDPSLGPGYVWHCHIIDHEDMSMMRPLIILPSTLRFPYITSQPANTTVCVGDAVSLSVTATSATTITYQWQVSTDNGVTWTTLTDDAVYTGTGTATLSITSAVNLSGNKYQCLLTNVDGTTSSNAATFIVNNCSVSGKLVYNNTGLDPLTGYTVTIDRVSALTAADGSFTVSGVTSGNHAVTITSALPAGGVNSTDAVNLNSWILGPVSIPNVTLLSGDVDKNLTIAAADATAIQNSFVSATAFAAPWVYWGKVDGTTVPGTYTVPVSGASVSGVNILAMSTGDFNSSYTPNSAATSNLLLTQSGHTLTVPAGLPFNLPINVSLTPSYTSVSAISLILNVPSALVTVNSVTIPGSATPAAFTYNAATGELRIGWNSTTPLAVAAGQPLVAINMTPTAAFTNLQIMTVTMVSSYLNEIADATFAPIINGELTVDNVTTSTSPTVTNPGLKLTVAPNPATTTITISFQLPLDGTVTLGIYDSKGVAVMPLILNNVNRLAGSYSIPVNISALIKGSYYVRLTEVSATKTMTTSIKFMKK